MLRSLGFGRFAPLLLLPACAAQAPARAARTGSPVAAASDRHGVREAAQEAGDADGMELRAEHGYLAEQDAEEAIQARFRDLTRCYDAAGPAQDFAAGAVRLQFRVEPSGRPSDVHVLESRLGNLAVERCLVEVGRTIAFRRPQGGAASVEYALEFRSTGALPVLDLPDREARAALSPLFPELAASCGRIGAEELTATLYVDGHGAVRSAGIASAAAPDPETVRCVVETAARVPLPASGAAEGVARLTVVLRDADLLAAAAPRSKGPATASRQARRPRR